jgi:phosphoribosylformylglycinamidine synthase
LPTIASKRWIFRQYDSMVGTAHASTNAPSDASVVLVKGTSKALAVTTDCNSRYVYADPYIGAMIAVSEAARNIVCSGGVPLGVTNCLNFGNPYDPEVYYQFVRAVEGMGAACRRFDTPVTGGNVSFYNQNPDGPVFPTPTIGMVGLLEEAERKMTLDFKSTGDRIVLLGSLCPDLGSSQYLSQLCGISHSPAPRFDLETEYAVQQKTAELIRSGLIRSAHDISEGGLFVSLLESGFPRGLGFRVAAPDASLRADAIWFGEAQSRIVVTVDPGVWEAFRAAVGDHPFIDLGTVTDGGVQVNGSDWGPIGSWKQAYDTAIERYLNREEAGNALHSL